MNVAKVSVERNINLDISSRFVPEKSRIQPVHDRRWRGQAAKLTYNIYKGNINMILLQNIKEQVKIFGVKFEIPMIGNSF